VSLVEIDGVHKSFGDLEVLRGVSLDIDQGEIVAVIGRSGSGKSTLLRCINGLEPIQAGTINLFPHLTAERNITLGLTVVKKMAVEEAREVARRAIAQVGLEDKLSAYPDMLSGGQQQRVAIARSLAMSPKLMLFDEITSALDPELIGEVLRVMAKLAEDGMTMMVVTHEIGFARNVAHRLVFMHDGEIWEEGAARAVLDSPKTEELGNFLGSVLH
jgi:polar amino acid transport system ATP-binding protein